MSKLLKEYTGRIFNYEEGCSRVSVEVQEDSELSFEIGTEVFDFPLYNEKEFRIILKDNPKGVDFLEFEDRELDDDEIRMICAIHPVIPVEEVEKYIEERKHGKD